MRLPWFALYACLLLASCNTALKNGKHVEISGIVRVVGNTPITSIVITDTDNNDWYIDDNESSGVRGELLAQQHKTITVRGVVKLEEIILANNKSLGMRRSLSKIKLL